MSREQDLLFCKIAITSGKVTQEAAQKCLAIANRFEAEGKRRPQVGAIFLKQNLLNDQDVHRIYGAVQKRLEAHTGGNTGAAPSRLRAAGAAAPSRTGKGPAAGRLPGARNGPAVRRAGRPVGYVRKTGGEPVDPNYLWMQVVFAVIAVGVILAIIYLLVFTGREKPVPEYTGGIPAKAAPASAPAAGVAPASAPLTPPVTPAKAAADARAAGVEKAIETPAAAPSPAAPPAPAPAAPPEAAAGASEKAAPAGQSR